MKKTIAFLLSITMLLLLCACGQSAKAKEEAEKEAADKDAANKVISLIDALNDSSTIDTINSVKLAYDELTDGQKTYVTNLQLLNEAEEKCTNRVLLETKGKIYDNIDNCNLLNAAIIDVWGRSIEDKYADFNKALSALYDGKEYKPVFDYIVTETMATSFASVLSTTSERHFEIENEMKQLSALQVDENVYNSLLDVYAEYVAYYEMIANPSGSYVSYSSDTNDAYNSITKAMAKLDAVIPTD